MLAISPSFIISDAPENDGLKTITDLGDGIIGRLSEKNGGVRNEEDPEDEVDAFAASNESQSALEKIIPRSTLDFLAAAIRQL